MPILVDYGSAGDLLGLASQAGTSQGTADRRAQQRAIDAQISAQAVDAAQRANARPGFYERAVSAGRSGGSPSGATGVQTFENDRTPVVRAQNEAAFGNPAQQAQRAAAATALEQYAAAKGTAKTPEAQYAIDAVRRGQDVPPQMEAGVYGDDTKTQLAREKLDIERSKLNRGPAPSAAEQRRGSDRRTMAYSIDAGSVADMARPDEMGRITSEAREVILGLLQPGIDPKERLMRADQLQAAGADATLVQRMREAAKRDQAAVQTSIQSKGRQAEQLAAQSGNFLAAAAQAGMSPQEIDQYLSDQEAALGLAPVGAGGNPHEDGYGGVD